MNVSFVRTYTVPGTLPPGRLLSARERTLATNGTQRFSRSESSGAVNTFASSLDYAAAYASSAPRERS
jgi:hypothetical protein